MEEYPAQRKQKKNICIISIKYLHFQSTRNKCLYATFNIIKVEVYKLIMHDKWLDDNVKTLHF